MTEPRTSQANEVERRQAQVVEDESADRPAKVPLTARLLLRESLTARRAAGIIAAFTVVITVAGGILERVLDHQEYPTIGRGLWFALQTVTTVGYGDVTPKQADGRFIGAVVMLAGIGFLAVITASVTASLVESSRRRFAAAVRDGRDAAARARSVSDWRGSKRHSISRDREVIRWRRLTRPSSTQPGRARSRPIRRRGRGAGPRGRIRRVFSGSRELVRIVYRDPEHVAERLTLYTADRLGDPSREWAQSARECPARYPARRDRRGAAYAVGARRADRRRDLRNAVLHRTRARLPHVSAAGDADDAAHRRAVRPRPREPAEPSAEMLALRGVHPDVEAAEAALIFGPRQGIPDRPAQRRSWRRWVHSVYLLLVFGGFMSPSVAEEDRGMRGQVRAVFGVAARAWGSG